MAQLPNSFRPYRQNSLIDPDLRALATHAQDRGHFGYNVEVLSTPRPN
jgi:hypothetical protein